MPPFENNPFASFAARIVPRPSESPRTESASASSERRLLVRLAPLKAKHEAWKRDEGESPTIEEYKRLSAIARKLLDVRKGRSVVEDESISPLHERLSTLSLDLSTKLSDRFSAFGKSDTITINTPELPEGLTQEHLDTINEALGGGLEERILPTLEDLHHLDAAYVDVMYPATQSEADKAKGLVSYRPSHWHQNASVAGCTFTDHPTWGEAFLHSMRQELNQIGGSLVLLDTAIKPNYIDGSQKYGTVEGTAVSKDPLLPLFQEAFGPEANRFSHSYKDIQEKLLPLAKEKIANALKEKGLSEVSFDVILVPATLENIDLTLHHTESSTTNTLEWTSTKLIDDTGNEAGHSLVAGFSGDDGAACVRDFSFACSYADLGARLAVVLHATER